MNCPECGQPLNPTARFCRSCGTTVAAAPAEGPAAPDRTVPIPQAAPDLPAPNVDKTLALTPAQGPTAPAPSYPPPVQQYQPQSYAPPAQNYPPPQPQYQNYGPPAQMPPVQSSGYPAYAAPGSPIPVTNGRIPAIIMLVSSLAMLVALFLPLFEIRGTNFSVFRLLSEVPAKTGDPDADLGVGLMASLAAGAVLALVFSGLALWKRRNLWGALSLVVSLYVLGLSALLWIGAEVSEEIYGLGVPVLVFGALLAFLTSIVFLFRKKVPA